MHKILVCLLPLLLVACAAPDHPAASAAATSAPMPPPTPVPPNQPALQHRTPPLTYQCDKQYTIRVSYAEDGRSSGQALIELPAGVPGSAGGMVSMHRIRSTRGRLYESDEAGEHTKWHIHGAKGVLFHQMEPQPPIVWNCRQN